MKTRAASSKHFTAEAWFDFVREVVSPEDKALMQRHLDSGCEACSQLCEIWSAVPEITTWERANDPPRERRAVGKGSLRSGQALETGSPKE
jgi:hypothetical protein